MKKIAVLFFILAFMLGAFGYWGAYTKNGRAHFDEMAGIIPMFAAFLALVFFLFAVIFFLIVLKKK